MLLAGFRISGQPPNRVVFFSPLKMDPVKEWRDQGAMDLENFAGRTMPRFASMLSKLRRREAVRPFALHQSGPSWFCGYLRSIRAAVSCFSVKGPTATFAFRSGLSLPNHARSGAGITSHAGGEIAPRPVISRRCNGIFA